MSIAAHPSLPQREPDASPQAGTARSGWLGLLSGKLSTTDRGLVALAGLAILLSLVLPIWWVYLWAPQYPDGLTVLIHARKLTGDVTNVNILNHYIGMKPLTIEAFPEFRWLTPVLSTLGGLFLLVALVGRRELTLPAWLGIFAFDFYMLYDLGFWLYNWGHELSPHAPMRVAPFMPPVLGFKHIANFTVFSLPAFGGCLVMLATAIGLVLPWLQYRRSH